MPSPKNGQAGTIVAPAAVKEAKDAAVADPIADKKDGIASDASSAQYEQNSLKPFKPNNSSEEGGDDKDKPVDWIEIVLTDKDGNPIAGEAYRIILPDGETAASGTLDDKGMARVEGIDPGSCKVTFPNLEKQAWKPK